MARRRTAPKLKFKKNTIYAMSVALLWSCALLIWLSFSLKGSLLLAVNKILVGNLGTVATFFLPFSFITAGFLVSKIKTSLANANVFVGSLIILGCLAGITRGGTLGTELWNGLAILVSVAGAGIFLFIGLVVGAVVMFNIPFEDIINWFIGLRRFFKSKPKTALNNTNTVIRMGGMAPQVAKPANVVIADKRPTQLTINPPTTASDSPWKYPPLTLLSETVSGKADRGDPKANADIIESTLEAFGITAKVVEVNLGPAVTQYALEVAIGTKLSKISSLSNDLALALAAPTGQIRIEAPIPGRSLVGIELPNRSPEFVSLRRMLESDGLRHHKSK